MTDDIPAPPMTAAEKAARKEVREMLEAVCIEPIPGMTELQQLAADMPELPRVLLTVEEFCARADISRSTWQRLRRANLHPRMIRIIGNVWRITLEDERAWIAARAADTPASYAPLKAPKRGERDIAAGRWRPAPAAPAAPAEAKVRKLFEPAPKKKRGRPRKSPPPPPTDEAVAAARLHRRLQLYHARKQ